MSTVGSAYVESGKFHPGLSLLGLAVGSGLGAVVGIGYAHVARFNPIIYLNFLLLCILVFLLILINGGVGMVTKSRNKVVSFLVGGVICFVAWFAHWCVYWGADYGQSLWQGFSRPLDVLAYAADYANTHPLSVSRRGNSAAMPSAVMFIVYVFELIIFFVPVFMAGYFDDNYYCEATNAYYTSSAFFLADAARFKTALANAAPGQYRFLSDFPTVCSLSELSLDPAVSPEVIKLTYYQASGCPDQSLLSVASYVYQYDNKQNKLLNQEKKLLTATYVDNATNQALLKRLTTTV